MRFYPNVDPAEAAKAMEHLRKIHQRIDDFYTLASTIESDNPERDAWKAVYGKDNPAWDKDTLTAEILKMFGKDTYAEEKNEVE